MEWNGDGTIEIRTNDLAEGPRSRTRKEQLKKQAHAQSYRCREI